MDFVFHSTDIKSPQESGHGKLANLGFIHIGKNAGTTIEEIGNNQLHVAWGKHLYGKRGWARIKTNIEGRPCESKYHMPPRYFDESVYFSDYNFCIIRNPLSRLVSEFKFSQRHPYDIARLHGLTKSKPFNKYFSHNEKGLNEWVIMALRLYHKDNFIHDCHLVPAFEFIFDETGQRTCQIVLQYEHLSEDFEKLKQKFHFEASLLHSYRSKETLVEVEDLNDTSLEMARSIYRDDFALLADPTFRYFDVD